MCEEQATGSPNPELQEQNHVALFSAFLVKPMQFSAHSESERGFNVGVLPLLQSSQIIAHPLIPRIIV